MYLFKQIFFATNIQMLVAGYVLCGLPWGSVASVSSRAVAAHYIANSDKGPPNFEHDIRGGSHASRLTSIPDFKHQQLLAPRSARRSWDDAYIHQ